MIIQFCGMSGVGKTTISYAVQRQALKKKLKVQIIDGDVYRKTICKDLGFTKEDRNENIRRLAIVADKFSKDGAIAIICAINPYESIRNELRSKYPGILTIYLDCSLDVLIQRDTKDLYKKAFLSKDDPDKIYNLSGVNDPFEVPENPDLHLYTEKYSIDECVQQILNLIENNLEKSKKREIQTFL
ncbi:MAG: adenylyl-sulfate kinase [Arachidicoccus sp.]|nr:adenylyl-sulfate kinase [Arachidicoccus sp.]